MKNLLTLLLAALLCISVTGCHADPAPTPDGQDGTASTFDGTAPSGSSTTGIVMPENIPPMESKVEIIGADGASLPYYVEMVCVADGMLVGDGALMFVSVPNHLPSIADKIPSVDLGNAPEIRATAREGVLVTGGETVDVYGEDFALIAEDITLADLVDTGAGLSGPVKKWAGRTVYLHFTVRFELTDTPDYVKSTTNAYFVRTTFPAFPTA